MTTKRAPSAAKAAAVDPDADGPDAARTGERAHPTSPVGPTAPRPDGEEDDGGTADFVTFVVEGETYAFPMARVEEIIRMPETVRVPLGPPSLEGLANLRGRVLPIVSLRSCCGLPAVEHDESTRVIVVDGGSTLGFVVDRVASVTSVDRSQVEPAEQVRAAVDSELLAGLIKAGARTAGQDPETKDDELVKILDVGRLVATQFELLVDRAGTTSSDVTYARAGEAEQRGEDGDDNTLELVSFAVDGQEYALPIDLVQEIVQAPERVTTVPNAPARVLGVMDLRGRLLPVVSLRQVFGLPQEPLEPQNRIVVVQLPGEGAGGMVVGVVMDTVREVLRVPHALVAALPEFMARAGRAREVESVCRLEEGRRLVSVLSVEQLFARDGLQAAVRDALVGAVTSTGPDDVTPYDVTTDDVEDDQVDARAAGEPGAEHGEDELLVVFRLAGEEYSVDVDAVQEIIRVPEALIRVPKALDFVEGLVNLRGAVLPVVDLRTRLGLARTDRDEQQRIIVLLVNGVRTGFIVDSVTEVLPVTRVLLEPAPELSPEQALLVRQVANLAATGRMLMLLETDHLLATEQLTALVPHQRSASDEEMATAVEAMTVGAS